MTVRVSVILPTFNRASSLLGACRSVLHQSAGDLELVVVDDASTEDIRSSVDSLSDPRVVYLRRDRRGGAAAARNSGLLIARGEYIAFQDSDDLWLPEKLRRQLELLERLPQSVGAVAGSKILYGRDCHHNYGSGRVTIAPPPHDYLRLEEDQVRRFLGGNRISLQSALFRRGCYPSLAWFDPCAKANNDWEFTARLAQYTKIYEDPEPVVVAFISSDSISRNRRKKLLGVIRIMKKNRAVMERYPDVQIRHLLQLSRSLRALGKRRWAWRWLMAAFRVHPALMLKEGLVLAGLPIAGKPSRQERRQTPHPRLPNCVQAPRAAVPTRSHRF